MRNTITLVLVLLVSNSIFAQDIWSIRDSVKGSPRNSGATFVVNNEGYVCTGYDGFEATRKNRKYNFFQDDWSTQTPLGGLNNDAEERNEACGFNINNKGYICLGQGGQNGGQGTYLLKDLWEYDPNTQAWSQKALFMGSRRRSAVAFSIGNKAYVGTGYDENGYCKDMYAYDQATNTWSQISDFAGTARQEAVGFTIGARGYVGTGDDGVKKKDFYEYNPENDTWTQKANFPGTARMAAVGWGIYPQGFICTGEDSNFEYKNDLWEYNVFSDSWVQRADLIGPGRSNAIAFTINNYGYVGMGYNGDLDVRYDDFYYYIKMLGGKELEANRKVRAYPNPTTEVLNIEGIYNTSDVQIYSAAGHLVTNKVILNQSAKSLTVKVESLSSGNYYFSGVDSQTGEVLYTNFVVQ